MTLSKPNHSQFAVGVALVIAVAVVGGLAWAFGQQLMLARQMRAEEMRLEGAVTAEQTDNENLAAQAEYVKSDECVEQWARKDAVMAKPGENAVVVFTDMDEEPAPDAQSTPPVEPETRPFWVELWELVFGPAAGSP